MDVLHKSYIVAYSLLMSISGALLKYFGASSATGQDEPPTHPQIWTNFPSLADEELAEQCEALGTTLHFEGHSDLDSRELVQEIKNFPDLPSKTMSLLELLTFIHDKDLSEIYPNFWTALRIAFTLPVTVAQAERSFSKLKLIKTYLRSTMSQERLTGLAVISINHSIGEQISYDDIIDDFTCVFIYSILYLYIILNILYYCISALV